MCFASVKKKEQRGQRWRIVFDEGHDKAHKIIVVHIWRLLLRFPI